MKNEILSSQIRHLIEMIREQQDLILSHQGKIPQIELDILMGNVRKLYESLLELSKLNEHQVVPSPVAPNPGPVPGSHHTDELIAHIFSPTATPNPQPNEQHPSSIPDEADQTDKTHPHAPVASHIQPETLIAGIDTPIDTPPNEISNEAVMPQASLAKERSKEFSKPSAKAGLTASLFDDHPTVSEKFPNAPSLYDKISSSRQDSSLAEKLLKNPVTDLKKSIGINEKFSFINELFDGDLNTYNEAIDKLNSSTDFNMALNHLEKNYAVKYNWNGESDSFLKLKNLIERRFNT